MSCSSILLPTSSGREGDDETSTAAESTSTVTNSHEDKTSNVVSSLSNFNNKPSSSVAESGNRRKLIRSNSFTVETPTFKNLPSCDSTNHSALVGNIKSLRFFVFIVCCFIVFIFYCLIIV